jgi:hypothetical protein
MLELGCGSRNREPHPAGLTYRQYRRRHFAYAATRSCRSRVHHGTSTSSTLSSALLRAANAATTAARLAPMRGHARERPSSARPPIVGRPRRPQASDARDELVGGVGDLRDLHDNVQHSGHPTQQSLDLTTSLAWRPPTTIGAPAARPKVQPGLPFSAHHAGIERRRSRVAGWAQVIVVL